MSNLVHIHVHSEYSRLDGMGTLDEIISKALDLGQKAVALTDHGSMSGLWYFQKKAKKAGIKPILGCEFYIQSEIDEKKNSHIIIIAKNKIGYENMCALHEFSYENMYRRPRITFEKLVQHKEGLIVTSACMGSDFGKYVQAGELSKSKSLLSRYRDEFGDDFYVELQPNEIPIQIIVNKEMHKLANNLGIATIIANDVHYVEESDAFPHEVMLGLQVNKKFTDQDRFKFSTNDFFFRSEEQMIEAFKKMNQEYMFHESVVNTSKIADKCEENIIERTPHLPLLYKNKDSSNSRKQLIEKVTEGLKKNRSKIKGDMKEYVNRIQNEIDVIDRNGYSDYFLIVQDYIKSARDNGVIVGNGRGSVGGSKVAFALDISKLNPDDYGLIFERFLADGREPDYFNSRS